VTVNGPIPTRTRWLLVLVSVLIVFGGACSSGGDDDDGDAVDTTPTTRPTSTTSTTEPVDDGEDAVREAYEAANRAFIEAAAIPDPEHPAIAATHTGPMLEQSRDVIAALKRDNRVIRYPANSQYRVVVEDVEIEGDVARFTFCAVDDGERVDVSTGDVVSSGVLTARGDAAMRRDGDVWKLAEQEFTSREEDVAACD
jgi:hypothetical protein